MLGLETDPWHTYPKAALLTPQSQALGQHCPDVIEEHRLSLVAALLRRLCCRRCSSATVSRTEYSVPLADPQIVAAPYAAHQPCCPTGGGAALPRRASLAPASRGYGLGVLRLTPAWVWRGARSLSLLVTAA